MTSWPPADKRITRGGQTLSARVWALLEDAYTGAGLDPALLVVTQGSWSSSNPSSGSTHAGGGAADLRTWNLPAWAREDLCKAVVVELRKRNGCAWYRDQAHGGFDPHIHVIVRDEPGLSSGARWQVDEYDAGRDGLSNGGRDYHPRPTQHPFRYPPVPPEPQPEPVDEEPPMYLFRSFGSSTGNGQHWFCDGRGNAIQLAGGYGISADVPVLTSSSKGMNEAWAATVKKSKQPS